jgi:cytochrome P450
MRTLWIDAKTNNGADLPHWCLLRWWLQAEEEFPYLQLPVNDQAATLVEMFVAGIFSGTATIVAAMYGMTRTVAVHDRVLERLKAELEESDARALPSYTSLRGLPILHAVVCESLRWRSPVPIYKRQITATTMVGPPRNKPGGQPVPLQKGEQCILSNRPDHRDRDFWQPMAGESSDPQNFDIRRWINGRENECSLLGEHHRFWPFGNGPRRCVAQPFAVMLIKTILSRVASKTRFRFTNESFQESFFFGCSVPLALECRFTEWLHPPAFSLASHALAPRRWQDLSESEKEARRILIRLRQ